MPSEPFVTIIMAVRNEEAFIAQSLGAVLHQDYPADRMDIVIADGASDDATVQVIRSMPGTERVRVVDNPHRIQAAGLNIAIACAKGDIIVRVDGHTVIAPDYVRQCVAALTETGAHAVGGAINPIGLTPIGKAIATATKSAFAVPGAFHTGGQGRFTDTVYMGAWPRSVLERLGGFDERLRTNEDYELHYRIRRAQGRIYLSPAIQSHYYGRQTFRALARQYFNYGRGKTRMLSKHPEAIRVRQVIAPGFVGFLAGGVPLSIMNPVLHTLWLAGAAAYLALNLAYAIHATTRARCQHAWLVPLTFLVIHLAWGAGFWVGLLSPRLATSTHAIDARPSQING